MNTARWPRKSAGAHLLLEREALFSPASRTAFTTVMHASCFDFYSATSVPVDLPDKTPEKSRSRARHRWPSIAESPIALLHQIESFTTRRRPPAGMACTIPCVPPAQPHHRRAALNHCSLLNFREHGRHRSSGAGDSPAIVRR